MLDMRVWFWNAERGQNMRRPGRCGALWWATLRASVLITEGRTAVSPICCGHIDRCFEESAAVHGKLDADIGVIGLLRTR
jgi:hypothetical protein